MGRGAVRPPPLFFCPSLKIFLGNSYLKILDLSKLFVADTPIKKSQQLYFYPLSEHFEIWVRKPPIEERVKNKKKCHADDMNDA